MTTKPYPTEVIRRGEGVEALLLQQAQVKVSRGPDKGKSATMSRGRLSIGSGDECDLVLTDGSASRRHCELKATPEGLWLDDLGSTNGTLIGELKLKSALLPAKTVIQIGRNELTISILAEREELALSLKERFGDLIGRSPVMRHVFALLDAAAQSDSTLLIEGESGTGKELAARAVHERSARTDGPFVVVDCGAVTPNLMESELFGHEKGAFTGAAQSREGAFAAADHGTLFLDEVGELDLALQPKLLRFLERRELKPVGSNTLRSVDVRVVAATNRRLEQLVQAKSFREDLFYRLAVLRVPLPALRERRDDVPALALAMAAKLRPDVDPASWLDAPTLAMLQGHDWPGNVRELRNVVERLAALPSLDPALLLSPSATRAGSREQGLDAMLTKLSYHDAKEQLLDRFEREYLTALLARENGVVARAADQAGVPRQTFFRLIKKHGLKGE